MKAFTDNTAQDAAQVQRTNSTLIEVGTGPTRWAVAKANITFASNVYTAKTIEFDPINQEVRNQAVRVRMRFDNTGNSMRILNDSTPFRGQVVKIFNVFRNNLVTAADKDVIFLGVMETPVFSYNWMTVEAVYGAVLQARFPPRLVSRTCGFQFGSSDDSVPSNSGDIRCDADVIQRTGLNPSSNSSAPNEIIDNVNLAVQGKADMVGITATTLQLKASQTFSTAAGPTGKDNNHYNGLTITMTSGANNGVSRTIDSGYTVVEFDDVASVGGSPTTIFVTGGLLAQPNDFYNGRTLRWKTGDNIGEQSLITDWDVGTDTITLTTATSNNIQVGDTFDIFDLDHITVTVAFGSANSTNDTFEIELDDFWKNGFVIITQSGGPTETRKVIMYDGSTGTLTLDRNLSFTPTTTDTYQIMTGCSFDFPTCQAENSWGPLTNNGIRFGGFPQIDKGS